MYLIAKRRCLDNQGYHRNRPVAMPPETDGGRASPFALFYGGALRDGRTAVLARAVIGPVRILRRQSGALLTVAGLNSWTAASCICELALSPLSRH